MTSLKNYGTRTLVGNWFEERITLDAHQKMKDPNAAPLQIRDMTVDVHIKANEEAPKMFVNEPFVGKTTYAHDTKPKRLERRNEMIARIYTAEKRRRMDGVGGMPNEPGSTITPTMLPTQFYDPYKTRYKTTYQKSYNIPEFETIRGTRVTNISTSSIPPRMTAMTETWVPGWKK